MKPYLALQQAAIHHHLALISLQPTPDCTGAVLDVCCPLPVTCDKRGSLNTVCQVSPPTMMVRRVVSRR
jgi:hypothetical protein